MTLDEAIKHCNDIINNCNVEGCKLDHIQLKDWLQELKWLRKAVYKENFETNFANIAEWAVNEIKPFLYTKGTKRIEERNRIKAILFRCGYYNENFKGKKIRDISIECSNFLDFTKD